VLSSASTCFAQGYDAACGEYVSQYARDFIAEYCTPTETKTVYDTGATYPENSWSGGAEFSGKFHACCTTGVYYMYKLALGIDIYEYGFNASTTASRNNMTGSYSQYWDNVTSQTLQPGDILLHVTPDIGHTEMYIGNNENANFGNSPYAGKVTVGPRLGSEFNYAFRLKNSVDVSPAGQVRSVSSNINYSKFFFNGIPDGKYSLANRPFWKVIIDTIAQVLDFLINLIFYIIRAVIVGYTSIMENLLNWIINVVADTNVEDKSLNMSSTEASTSDSENKITVDKILFNKLEIFDINVFDQD
jgi:hypothetical protein